MSSAQILINQAVEKDGESVFMGYPELNSSGFTPKQWTKRGKV